MKTAVLIDDDQVSRSLLAVWLKDEGWTVIEASDGEAGLALAQEYRPALVVCDLLMPRCNGFQVCRALRSHRDLFAKTRIVVTTGSAYETDRLAAADAGADSYLVKPVRRDDLIGALDVSGNHHPASAPAPAATVPHPPSPALPPPEPSTPRIRFWGVRGSIPTPGPTTVYYGGNTSCVEVRADGEIIILDAGTGIRPLGMQLAREFKGRSLRMTLLLSHTHWDHIQGFPFFVPAYNKESDLRILGYEGARKGLESTLSSQMESPNFPIGMHQMPGHISIQEIKDLHFKIGEISLQAEFMNHPGVCVGYRLTTSGGSVAYVPDNEPFLRYRPSDEEADDPEPVTEALTFARERDKKLVAFLRHVDHLIIDCQYDAAEYATHVGWGHGCVDDVVALAIRAEVKQLYLFHHDPTHDDEKVYRMLSRARELIAREGGKTIVEAAREGVEVPLIATAAGAAVHAAHR